MRLSTTAGTLNRMHVGRWMSLLGGSLLMSLGVRRHARFSWMLVPVGAGIVYGTVRSRRRNGTSHAVSVPFRQGICIAKAVMINKSPEELYSYWRDLVNLPRFAKQLESVQVIDSMHSHWTIRSAAGQIFQWDAEIVNEIPNELIGWRSLAGADLNNAGSVHFDRAPGGRGTMVKVEIEYEPPVHRIGDAVAKLLGQDPSQMLKENLLRLKELMETGEIATIEGQPRGSRNVLTKFA